MDTAWGSGGQPGTSVSGKNRPAAFRTGPGRAFGKAEEGFYPKLRYVFSSPMKRCVQTAEALYPDIAPTLIPEWEEMDFGRFELKNYRELKEDAYYQAWIDSGGTLPFPEGESREAFIRRCEAGFQRMRGMLGRRPAEEGANAVTAGMVVHGGTMMALFSRYCGGAYFDYQTANGDGFRCRIAGCGERAVLTALRPLAADARLEKGRKG